MVSIEAHFTLYAGIWGRFQSIIVLAHINYWTKVIPVSNPESQRKELGSQENSDKLSNIKLELELHWH